MSFLQIPIGTYPNTFLGYESSISITTGISNTAFGNRTLNANTSGNWNSTFGNLALEFNQTGTENSAFGDRALRVSRGSGNSGFGSSVMLSLFTGLDNSAFGTNALYRIVSGNRNAAFGANALSFPFSAESENSAFGYGSLNGLNGGNRNSAFGYQSGVAITSGSKNTILGSYSGNQGGLDIRTLSNYIVISDGDGNPRIWVDNTGLVNFPGGAVLPGGTANGVLYLNASGVVTSGTALVFTGTNLGIGTSSPGARLHTVGASGAFLENTAGGFFQQIGFRSGVPTFAYYDSLEFGYATGQGFSGYTATMRLTTSGNLGLGVTPSAWVSYTALQVASIGGALSSSSSSDFEITTNAYYNGGWLSQGAGVASTRYRLLSGSHSWWTSGTSPGVAGSPISFTQAMTLDASGNLVVGGTTAIGRGTFVNTSAGDGVIIRSNGFDTNKSGANNALLLGLDYTTGVGYIVAGGNTTNTSLSFFTASVAAPVERARIPAAGGMVVGTAALATNATDGFLYVPTCAGQPTGTPTTQTGTAPIVVDTTNNKLYFYSGGAWRDAGP